MSGNQYAATLYVDNLSNPAAVSVLPRLDRGIANGGQGYQERWLQNLVFRHPEALPVEEIDSSFKDLIPVCCELNTPAGPLDAVFVNRHGMLTLVECKLWRNPEARREVVGQILDYAKEIGRWSYEDLQREVSAVLKRPGNTLYELVRARYPELEEMVFVDEVSKNLRQGRFLLLIVGDGIRDGVESIAEFLRRHAALHFTFGLVEIAIFKGATGGFIVQPRVIARSMIVHRTVVELQGAGMAARDDQDDADREPQISERAKANIAFWTKLLDDLRLDDPSQPRPRPSKQSYLGFSLPSRQSAWITTFRANSSGKIGVFLRIVPGALAQEAHERLAAERSAIESEIGAPLNWVASDGGLTISINRTYPDVLDPKHEAEQIAWLRDYTNRFVNAFRKRVERLAADLRTVDE